MFEFVFYKESSGTWSVEKSMSRSGGEPEGDEGGQGGSMESNGDAIWSHGERTVARLLALAPPPALCHRHVHAYAHAPSRALPLGIQSPLPQCKGNSRPTTPSPGVLPWAPRPIDVAASGT